MDTIQNLRQSYRTLSKLYFDAWIDPAEVPIGFALILLHAREYIGKQLHSQIQTESFQREEVGEVVATGDYPSSELTGDLTSLSAGLSPRLKHESII